MSDDKREPGSPQGAEEADEERGSDNLTDRGSVSSLPELSDEEEEELRHWLRDALDDEEGGAELDVLAGVQQKLRERSGGKFYADGWSTANEQPVATYLVTSTLMLVVLLVIYVVLGPISGVATEVPLTPAPVHVVPAP
ncbi:MAG: hypothetical protein KIT72_04465 [Polyangiaceae bacterium]|nr:hypothetical protein [Polyangiaceae bacterium]MCW5789657.1 hypothetical protein [Polyangiaceae bacterium]